MQSRPVFRTLANQTMTFALHQSLAILQMPLLELSSFLEKEIDQNPLFEEITIRRRTSQSEQLQELSAETSWKEYLFAQAREVFEVPKELELAFLLIHHLDDRGWLTVLPQIAEDENHCLEQVLTTLKTFDPPGVGAKNLQESYLLQLQKQPYSLAEVLVRDHFQDLLKGRFASIQKKLNISLSEIQRAIRTLSYLPMHPVQITHTAPSTPLIADITIQEEEGAWIVKIGEEELPRLSLRTDYLDLQSKLSEGEEKKTLRTWITSAKWLQRSLLRRKETLFRIGKLLLREQRAFLTHTGKIRPIAMSKLAERLGIHESTAWRAVAHKTLNSPCGMISLKCFFAESAKRDHARELIEELIQQEDKKKPLTDESLAYELSSHGIKCARRTVAKYRKLLKLSSAKQRRRV